MPLPLNSDEPLSVLSTWGKPAGKLADRRANATECCSYVYVPQGGVCYSDRYGKLAGQLTNGGR